MKKSLRQFPLVPDNEPVITQARQMALYDNSDLINNIKGHYQERDYGHEPVLTESAPVSPVNQQKSEAVVPTVSRPTEASLARQQAKQDVRQKKQAIFKQEVKKPSKEVFKHQLKATAPKPKAGLPKTEFSDLSERLRQEHYILAEIPVTYQEPNNKPSAKRRKNSYDFLKRSQIYNQQQESSKDHRPAQELNMARFEDIN